jgi:hypothetical protein
VQTALTRAKGIAEQFKQDGEYLVTPMLGERLDPFGGKGHDSAALGQGHL